MQITYRREGGLAYLPGLSRPLQLDTAAMAEEQAARLEQLVAAADLFGRDEPAAPAQGAADLYSYTLTIRQGRRRRTLRLTDPINEVALQELLAYLEQLRTGGPSPSP
jgi:hypothetical protein